MPQLPLGALCPDNPHAVVVSLPSLNDVIGYETGCPRVKAAVRVGYPRFVLHKYVTLLTSIVTSRVVGKEHGPSHACILVCDGKLAEALLEFVRVPGVVLQGDEVLSKLISSDSESAVNGRYASVRKTDDKIQDGGATASSVQVCKGEDCASRSSVAWAAVVYERSDQADSLAKVFAQHTGCRMSSRHSFDVLTALRHVPSLSESIGDLPVCHEPRIPQEQSQQAEEAVLELLGTAFTYQDEVKAERTRIPATNVILTNSGMGAFTALYSAANALWQGVHAAARARTESAGQGCRWKCPNHPAGRHRDTWLQLGWLYLDTTCAMLRFAPEHCPTCDELDSSRMAPRDAEVPPGVVQLGKGLVQVLRVDDTEALEYALQQWGHRLAGVVTECPTNPLVTTPDLAGLTSAVAGHTSCCLSCGERLHAAAGNTSSCTHPTHSRAIVMADPTMAGLGNVDVTWEGEGEKAAHPVDVGVVSLTKYAAGSGDVMAGAAVLHPNSPFTPLLSAALGISAECTGGSDAPYLDAVQYVRVVPWQKPYKGDLCRLAAQVHEAPSLVAACNANAMRVAEWLQARIPTSSTSPAMMDASVQGASSIGVRAVHWAYASAQARGAGIHSDSSCQYYSRLAVGTHRPGSMMTIELAGTWPSQEDVVDEAAEGVFHDKAQSILARFYDALPLVKGPSFGTTFCIACPFLYLAHYDLVSCSQGRAQLRAAGLNPYLIRLHVGAEPVKDILCALEQGLGLA